MAATCVVWLALTSPLWADQIVMDQSTYPGAKIVGYEEGRIQFRTADGNLQRAWPSDIDLIIVDRGGAFVDFNQAERYLAAGEPDQAIGRYRRTLRLMEGFWIDLVESRLLTACDRAGDFRRATLYFIRVVRGPGSGPPAAVRLMPQAIPHQPDATIEHAIGQVEQAVAEARDETRRAPLELYRYEILRRVSDPRAKRAAEAIASMAIPKPLRCERVSAIQLAALEAVLGDEVSASALAALDRAARHCPRAMLPGFLLLKGQALLRSATTREEFIRAAWAFMRVAIHFQRDPRAAEGLLGAALALERMGRSDRAIAMLEECLRRRELAAPIRRAVEEALERLQSSGADSG